MNFASPTYGYPAWFLIGAAFVFGAALGSFLNVVVARVPTGESIVWPGSHCCACGKGVRASHNIPIASWFLLRGRCSECLAPFSIRYALVELGYALVCAFAVARHGVSPDAAREVLLMAFLVVLTGTDLDHWLLPHEITWPGIAVGLFLAAAQGYERLLWHLLAGAVGYTLLVVIGYVGERAFQKEAVGGGDPWLLALIGAFLGVRALPAVLLLASLQGTVIGLVMIAARRRSEARREEDAPQTSAPAVLPQAPGPAGTSEDDGAGDDHWMPDPTAIPFGPFLALGAAEVLYFARLPLVLFPWPF